MQDPDKTKESFIDEVEKRTAELLKTNEQLKREIEERKRLYTIYIDSIFYGEIQLFWDENGVRYEIKQVSESDEYHKKVLSVYMPIIKERYSDDSIKFENVVGRLLRLYIKYSDRPFNWLYKATPREITDFAEKISDDAWGLRWGIEGTIEKLYEKVSS